LHIIVKQGIDVERHKHLSFENGGVPRLLKFHLEQLLDIAFELGSDSLGFVGDVQRREGDIVFLIRLDDTSKHLDKRSFTSTILSEHDDSF